MAPPLKVLVMFFLGLLAFLAGMGIIGWFIGGMIS